MSAPAAALASRIRTERDLIGVVAGNSSEPLVVAQRAADWLDFEVVSLAKAAFSETGLDVDWAPSVDCVLVDLELLFTPELHVDPLSHLRRTGRSRAVVALWPGDIGAGRMAFSVPTRRDHYDTAMKHVLMLTAVDTPFPDEDPFEVEYHPA